MYYVYLYVDIRYATSRNQYATLRLESPRSALHDSNHSTLHAKSHSPPHPNPKLRTPNHSKTAARISSSSRLNAPKT